MIRYAVELTDSKGASIKTTIDAWDRADLDLKALAMYPLHKMKVKSEVCVRFPESFTNSFKVLMS